MSETESKPLDNNKGNNAAVSGSLIFHGSAGRPKKENNLKQEGAATDSGQYPQRPGEPNCMYYLRTGSCGYGTNCRYNHPTNVAQDALCGFGDELPERDGEPDCGFFLKTGTCKYGSSCKYNHPKDRNGASPVSFNIIGLPMRPEENPCMFYMRTGRCKYGAACKFHHPQPAVSRPVFPINGSASPGFAEPSTVPIRAFPAFPIPAVAYAYDHPMQSPQAYISMSVSPSHGILHHQYPGILSPASSSSTYGSSPNASYPERTDRPNCRYFMNYGACKYGPDCKYNHPRERVPQMLPHPLNPLGLPINPGQPLCASYITCRICQNGLMCKFHHQIGGYPVNGFSTSPMPLPSPMPIFNQPLFGKMASTAVISSETSSPSKSSKDLDSIIEPEPEPDENQHSGTNGQQESHKEEPAAKETQHSGTNGQREWHKEEAAAEDNQHSETQHKSNEEETATEETQHLGINGPQKSNEEDGETSGNPSPDSHSQQHG